MACIAPRIKINDRNGKWWVLPSVSEVKAQPFQHLSLAGALEPRASRANAAEVLTRDKKTFLPGSWAVTSL